MIVARRDSRRSEWRARPFAVSAGKHIALWRAAPGDDEAHLAGGVGGDLPLWEPHPPLADRNTFHNEGYANQ
jgi:hypothetical protein